MRTDDFRPSDNVEDDREASASRGGIPGGTGGLGIGTIIIIGLISWYFGIDPSVLLNGAQILTGGGSTSQQTSPAPPVTAGTPSDLKTETMTEAAGEKWRKAEGGGKRCIPNDESRMDRFPNGD